jgi:hypothetical protein
MLKQVRIDGIILRASIVTFFLISALCLNLSCKSDDGGVVEFIEPTIDGLVGEGEYTKSKSFGGLFGNYKIYWGNDESFFYIAMKVKTDGWVAVGFQPEPGDIKKDVDFILGYVANGEVFVFDLFSEKAEGPHRFDESLGGSNNIIEYDGSETDGYTVIEFKRALNTGDPNDYIVKPGSVNILWSYSQGDDILESHEGHRGYSAIDF